MKETLGDRLESATVVDFGQDRAQAPGHDPLLVAKSDLRLTDYLREQLRLLSRRARPESLRTTCGVRKGTEGRGMCGCEHPGNAKGNNDPLGARHYEFETPSDALTGGRAQWPATCSRGEFG
jgi:hypothetical protein